MTGLNQYRSLIAVVALWIIAMMQVSCGSSRDVTYIHDAERDVALPITNRYIPLITPGDRLYIHIDSDVPDAAVVFNQETNHAVLGMMQGGQVSGYLVDSRGEIMFPQIGNIHCAGITHDSLAALLSHKLRDGGYLQSFTVTTRLMNYHVSVVGEVQTPKEVRSESTRLTLFEALADAGDITLQGMKDSVVVVRYVDSKPEMAVIDLTSKDFLSSPYYYLQSNDVVYVPPTRLRRRQAHTDYSGVPYVVSIGASGIRLFYHITRLQMELNKSN